MKECPFSWYVDCLIIIVHIQHCEWRFPVSPDYGVNKLFLNLKTNEIIIMENFLKIIKNHSCLNNLPFDELTFQHITTTYRAKKELKWILRRNYLNIYINLQRGTGYDLLGEIFFFLKRKFVFFLNKENLNHIPGIWK